MCFIILDFLMLFLQFIPILSCYLYGQGFFKIRMDWIISSHPNLSTKRTINSLGILSDFLSLLYDLVDLLQCYLSLRAKLAYAWLSGESEEFLFGSFFMIKCFLLTFLIIVFKQLTWFWFNSSKSINFI